MPEPAEDATHAEGRGFGRRFATGMTLVSVIAFGMFLLTRNHIIFPIEAFGEHVFFAGSAGQVATNDEPGVTLVEISEEDYECPSLFDGKSPLRRDLVYELINKVAQADSVPAHQPTAVVVDIDLSGQWSRAPATTYKPGDLACSNGKKFPFAGLPALEIGSDKLTVVGPTRIVEGPKGRSIPVLADSHFGVKLSDGSEAREALSLFPYDWDHRARSFLKQVEVRRGATGEDFTQCESFPTLALVADKKGLPPEGGWKNCEEPGEDERFFIDFSKSKIRRYKASEILTEKNISFKDQIVVIGGTYSVARDSYFTPIGSLAGMELVGLSIDAVQHDEAIGKASEWMELVVDLLIGAVLVILAISGLGLTGTLLTLAAIVVLPLASSLMIFHTAKLFLNFMPIVLGAVAHMVYDRHQEVKEDNELLKKRLESATNKEGELRRRIRNLRRQRHDLRLRSEELRGSGVTANFNISTELRRQKDDT